MPLLRIQTNQSIDDRNKLLAELSEKTATLLGKSENYVMVVVEGGASISFAGSSAPAMFVELKSLGLSEERTAHLSAELCDFLGSRLAVPQDRIYIEFSSASRPMWGWNGKTF